MKLTPMEFNKLVKGYYTRRKAEDARRAFFTAVLASPHLKKPMNPNDIMKVLYPLTAAERKQAEEEFIREFRAEGGEI